MGSFLLETVLNKMMVGNSQDGFKDNYAKEPDCLCDETGSEAWGEQWVLFTGLCHKGSHGVILPVWWVRCGLSKWAVNWMETSLDCWAQLLVSSGLSAHRVYQKGLRRLCLLS